MLEARGPQEATIHFKCLRGFQKVSRPLYVRARACVYVCGRVWMCAGSYKLRYVYAMWLSAQNARL